jgi:hypothetical protein
MTSIHKVLKFRQGIRKHEEGSSQFSWSVLIKGKMKPTKRP